jgi:glutamate-1-semialdehyde 2,1-aminomutase
MSVAAATRLDELYQDRFPQSARLAARARDVFPNGVTHDGRFLEPHGVYISHARGSKKYSVEGHEIVDFYVGHGSLLLGHSHPAVVDAVQRQMSRGTHFGSSHALEVEWGECVRRMVPSAERIRFTSSGTEATLMGLRICRIITGRPKILKFAGHFHGWHDWLIPGTDPPYPPYEAPTPGVTDSVLDDLVIIPPNDADALTAALDQHAPACVILEPTGGHWGQVPIRGEFLRTLREETRRRNIILIFDEVITGFRVSPGGAQRHYGITPDLTSMAKILAGGLPGGCLAGNADLMRVLEFGNPLGKKMKHPGTYNGNPLSAAAGIAALNEIHAGGHCERANEIAARIRGGLNALFSRRGVDWISFGEFSMISVLPGYSGPRPTDDSFIPYGGDHHRVDPRIDASLTHALRRALLLGGVDFFGGWRAMTSSVHSDDDVEKTIAAFDSAIELLRSERLIA